MKKLPIVVKRLFIGTFALSSVLVASSVSAAEDQPQPIVEQVQIEAPTDSVETPLSISNEMVQPPPTIDNTTRVVKDGIHLDVLYNAQAFIPEFTLELWSVTEDKPISSAVGNSKNYDKVKGAYHLIFNHPSGFKLGDELAFILRKADGVVEYIKFQSEKPNEKGQYTFNNLERDTNYLFPIDSFTYFEGEEGNEKAISDLIATNLHPIKASLQTNSKKIGLLLQSESGTPLKKTPIDIKLLNNKGAFKQTSDDDGMVWIDSNKLTWKFLVSSPGKVVNGSNKFEVELPQVVVIGQQKEAITIPVVFQNEVAAQTSNVKVNLSPVGNTDLSTSWTEVDVTLSSSDGVSSAFTLNPENKTISGLPDGTYKVTVEGKYANASLKSDSINVKNGSASLDVQLKPKYTLEIDKDGKPFSFTVINVEKIAEKIYKGKDAITYGVTPGESFMIKDNDTGKIDNVFIDPKSEHTKVILGGGVVFGGSATIPHTGDSIVWDIICFVASVLGAALVFVKMRRKTKNAN
ncbi:hypothetical protein [Paenibacillus piri]|uniref:Uncharacterized protein n=1 Tax=Paenibacillus piri TaxID=2547395 RepID=A0A4R5L048_9BACL|nr:hypothetical protein [Paenibacillus piri]TDG00866.1 hypothetical protein E1757_04450 [Paenibacillus piri]